MKKILVLALSVACITIFLSTFSFNASAAVTGQNNVPSNTVTTLSNPLKVNSIGELIKSGVQVFSYIAVLIAVVMFVVVGLKYIFAMGKPDKMKEASQWLLYIVIGVAIVLGANLAVNIVINTLSATGAVDPKVIQSAKDALK